MNRPSWNPKATLVVVLGWSLVIWILAILILRRVFFGG